MLTALLFVIFCFIAIGTIMYIIARIGENINKRDKK